MTRRRATVGGRGPSGQGKDAEDLFVGPILGRELLVWPRRPRHYVLRASWVGALFVLIWTAWQAIVGFQEARRPTQLAAFNAVLFPLVAYVALTLVLFAASLYGATSISHEKDRRTFVLLLVTRLADWQIVIGKFLCVLLQIGTLLLASLPVMALTALLGGVGFDQVLQVNAVLAAAAFGNGAIGILVGVWREKTAQAVALTILAIVLAILGIEAVAALGEGWIVLDRPVSSWCDCLSPVRAITSVVEAGVSQAPLPFFGRGHHGYVVLGLALGSTCLAVATAGLRAWNPRSEPTSPEHVSPEKRVILVSKSGASYRARFGLAGSRMAAGPAPDGPRPRAAATRPISARPIWSNPVLWREIRTRAYGPRPILVKLGFLAIFGLMTWGLFLATASPAHPKSHELAAWFVLPLAILSLLLVNAQAASAVTSERDLRSLDLLLATDLSPAEFVYGKLGGILVNTKEMVAAPLALLAICAAQRLIGPVGLVFSGLGFLVLVGFAAVLGVHSGLRYEGTRLALANSLGTMFLLSVGILLCLFLILVSGRFEAQWGSFILFIVVGSIGLWISLSANAPSNALGLAAASMPFGTFYCIIAFLQQDRVGPFLVGAGVYGFALLALLVPLLSEFDVATGRTSFEGL